MRILLSVLLIPLFVLGQALPHSHAGSVVAVPNDHAARQHVHLSGGHAHHHAGDDHSHSHSHTEHVASAASVRAISSCVASSPDEHDSDAIYIAQPNSSFGRGSAMGQLNFASVAMLVEILADRAVPSEIRCCTQSSDCFAGLPLYLLTAALRL